MNRLTSGAVFAQTIRRGRRAGGRTVVLHLALPAAPGSEPPRIGFVVSKQVGNAVTRNTVKRRLRHLARERISSLPGSAVLVVRAQPASAGASYAELAADLDRALSRVLGRSDLEGGAR
ncbi:MAG TPA: ribonuclease P protein component [Nocardioidaceae bacterium]|nr:ribonuclease P protein component [Nocardioidaceae bacterium]